MTNESSAVDRLKIAVDRSARKSSEREIGDALFVSFSRILDPWSFLGQKIRAPFYLASRVARSDLLNPILNRHLHGVPGAAKRRCIAQIHVQHFCHRHLVIERHGK